MRTTGEVTSRLHLRWNNTIFNKLGDSGRWQTDSTSDHSDFAKQSISAICARQSQKYGKSAFKRQVALISVVVQTVLLPIRPFANMPSVSVSQDQLPQNHQQVVDRYREKLKQQQSIIDQCNRQWSKFAYARGGVLLLFLVALFLAWNGAWAPSSLPYYVAGLVLAVFIAVAWKVETLETSLRHSRKAARMFRESIARCTRQWDDIEVPAVEIPPELKAVSTDLDMFTDSSIYKLLGITRTPLGTETLANWIRDGAAADEVSLRQEAVKELQPKLQWREDFQLRCEQLSSSHANPTSFVDWANRGNWFENRSWILWLARITAVCSLVLIGLWLTTLLSLAIAGPLLLVLMAINFGFAVVYSGSIHEQFNQISTQANEARGYVELFQRVATFEAKSKRLQALQAEFRNSESGAQKAIGRLGKLTGMAMIRRGSGFILYLVLEFLFFWDIHILDRMEQWKSKHGSQVHNWFSNLGQWETLCALAKLAADEPSWNWPTVKQPAKPDDKVITASNLAHPLLGQERVHNDVEVGPPGSVLLVTGSNMSGKSTLLRSIGANAVLAQMGSVVCADSMSLPPLRIQTSMRIADSLADGVSFFMAELKRLKQIVDVSKEISAGDGKTMLFLLDEILQGTNSRERQIAVSRVVRKLIDSKAIGCISTHDLDLARTKELADACRTVHFSEQFVTEDGKQKMTFDYQIKQGIAKTTNALKLLELVGLGEDE